MRSIKGAVEILSRGTGRAATATQDISIVTVIDFDDVVSGTIKSHYQHRGDV